MKKLILLSAILVGLTPSALAEEVPHLYPEHCLSADTMIQLESGETKQVSQVVVGDSIKSPLGTADIKSVVSNYYNGEMLEILLDNGTSLNITTEHPFYISGQFILAEDLNVGENLNTVTGSTSIVEINKYDFKGTVYNLVIDENESHDVFFANNVAVGGAVAQHSLD